MSREWHTERLRRNARSKPDAINDGRPWSSAELDLLRTWDMHDPTLPAIAAALGHTIEACREKFYLARRTENWSGKPALRSACPQCFLVHGSAQEEC